MGWIRKLRAKLIMSKKYTFNELKPQLQAALMKKATAILREEEKVTWFEGFLNQSIQNEIGGDSGLTIGGPSVPVVAFVGKKSGRVYYYAVKVLLPDLDL